MFVLIWVTLLFAVRSNNANTDVEKLKITGTTVVAEGDTLNLTCSSDSIPLNKIMWTKLGSNKTDLQNDQKGSLIIPNVTAEHSGQYICTAQHLNNSLISSENISVTVTYVKKPEITGKTTVKEGETLKLTCRVDSFPQSALTCTKLGSSKTLSYETGTDLHNDGGTATLPVIPNLTAEHAGQYICTANHLNSTLQEEVNSVTLYPKILRGSGCIKQSEVLTCVCISQGVPLPAIKWPLLEDHTEYSGITTVSNHTVNSTVILTVKGRGDTAVECVSSNDNGKTNESLIIKNTEEDKEGQAMKMLRIVTRLEIIIAFLFGALLSAIICCLATTCHRKRKRTYGDLAEILEMVTSHEDQLVDAGQAVEDDQAINPEAAEGGGAVAAGKSDVEYSTLKFSLIKKSGAGTTQETTETEYAEIKKEVEARADGGGKEEEEVIGEDEEAKQCVADEMEGEDVALYSSIEDVMGFEESVV